MTSRDINLLLLIAAEIEMLHPNAAQQLSDLAAREMNRIGGVAVAGRDRKSVV